MESNVPSFITETFEKYKVTLVINDSYRVERLIAIGDDDEDYYWITYNGRRAMWNTCVGSVIPLKGFIPDDDYNRLLHRVKLNDFTSPILWNNNDKEGTKKINKEAVAEIMDTRGEKGKFITELCLEFN